MVAKPQHEVTHQKKRIFYSDGPFEVPGKVRKELVKAKMEK